MLEVKNLTCGYDGKFLLRDIDFQLRERELLGIIGPNGSGKTTLFRALTRILPARKGEIYFEGRDIRSLSFRELARRVAVVSQASASELNMPVEDYVLLGRIPHRRPYQFLETAHDEEAVERSLALTHSEKFRERFLSELSDGERQLVFISRALAQEPKLLLLDEPTSHLDISHQVKILDLIRRLNKEKGITVLIILHDLNLASEYCDRLLLLHNGYINKMGSPHEVLTYQIIEAVYQTVVIVKENPLSSKPYVVIVSEEERLKKW